MDRYQKIVSEKAKNKRSLLGSTFFPRTPVVLVDLSQGKKARPYTDLLEGMNTIGIHTFVVCPAKKEKLPEGSYLHLVEKSQKSAAYDAADFVIVLDSAVIKDARVHNCVPIAQMDGESTINYNALKENGNGFYFKQSTKWEIFAALIRALETYQFPYDWQNVLQEAIKRER